MAHITYVEANGQSTTIELADGWSLMQGATTNGIDGILGECGGSCACATCHVFVDEEFMSKVGEAGPLEDDMLDGSAEERTACSRLSCQIKMNADLDGLRVRIASEQV